MAAAAAMSPKIAASCCASASSGRRLVEPTNLYGDGATIAARLEQIADPGGNRDFRRAYDRSRTRPMSASTTSAPGA